MPFQHTAARRRLGSVMRPLDGTAAFQHTAARRRLGSYRFWPKYHEPVSTHSRPKAAGSFENGDGIQPIVVSTHSRPKAAGFLKIDHELIICVSTHSRLKAAGCRRLARRPSETCFNTQPPEGGWLRMVQVLPMVVMVSTHSRLKAAGARYTRNRIFKLRFNTQPPEGGWTPKKCAGQTDMVSTHSRLKAAGQERPAKC